MTSEAATISGVPFSRLLNTTRPITSATTMKEIAKASTEAMINRDLLTKLFRRLSMWDLYRAHPSRGGPRRDRAGVAERCARPPTT